MRALFGALIACSAMIVSCQTKTETGLATVEPMDQALVQVSSETKTHIATLDEQDRRILEQLSPRTIHRIDERKSLTVHDIIKLSEGGISDQSIIRYIRETRSKYSLSQVQIKRLQNAGVSPRVINYIIETGR